MSSRRSAIQYKPTDQLYLWLVTQPTRPILIGELHLIRTTRGVSLRYAPEWLQRGFPLSEDLPLIDEELIPTESAIASGAVEKLMAPPIVVSGWDVAGKSSVVLSGGDTKYTEIHAVEGKSLRQLTHQNDVLFAELDVAQTEEVGFKSKDGAEVFGLLTKPLGYVAGTKVPLLLRIPGGPNSQDQHTINIERQYFAANGDAVLAINYRGSSGRGGKFSRAFASASGSPDDTISSEPGPNN